MVVGRNCHRSSGLLVVVVVDLGGRHRSRGCNRLRCHGRRCNRRRGDCDGVRIRTRTFRNSTRQ